MQRQSYLTEVQTDQGFDDLQTVQNRIYITDDQPVVENQPSSQMPSGGTRNYLYYVQELVTNYVFPVWDMVFHANVKLEDGREGLLVDTGAVRNLTGSAWVDRMSRLGQAHGRGTEVDKLERKESVEGVGPGSTQCENRATVPIALADGSLGTYAASMIESSDVPALLGLRSLQQMGAVIDLQHDQLIMVGKGGFDMKLSPGSSVHRLERSSIGHLFLPASEWAVAQGKGQAARRHVAFLEQEGPLCPE
jgi:hypothetical protein